MTTESPETWPISYDDVRDARVRLREFLEPTPVRNYPLLDEALGGVEVWVKHENLQPTHAFKVRNGLSAMSLLGPEERSRGVIAATRGNHGLGICFAGQALGVPVTICVPEGNNPEKNAAIHSFGARLIEEGADYDESVETAARLAKAEGLATLHSTNNRGVIAGAATITDEFLDQAPALDALFVSIGGGSQAVGALTVIRERSPQTEVYGVQAAKAPAQQLSWSAGAKVTTETAQTIADGLATRSSYEFTRAALKEGLTDFLLVEEEEMLAAMRVAIRYLKSIVEPAGAAGLAGLRGKAATFRGRRVGVILSGANAETDLLKRALDSEV